jgi:hypothetical protein
MGMTPKLHSIETLAVETGRDRRTVARALRNVTPDGKAKGRPAYRMATALAALNRRAGGTGSTTRRGDPDADGLLQLATTIQQGFQHARSIANIEERREFLKELGPSVGLMDQKLSALNPDDQIMGTIVHEHILGGTISTFLKLMEMTLRPEQGARA